MGFLLPIPQTVLFCVFFCNGYVVKDVEKVDVKSSGTLAYQEAKERQLLRLCSSARGSQVALSGRGRVEGAASSLSF